MVSVEQQNGRIASPDGRIVRRAHRPPGIGTVCGASRVDSRDVLLHEHPYRERHD